jgi:hypothetical protein
LIFLSPASEEVDDLVDITDVADDPAWRCHRIVGKRGCGDDPGGLGIAWIRQNIDDGDLNIVCERGEEPRPVVDRPVRARCSSGDKKPQGQRFSGCRHHGRHQTWLSCRVRLRKVRTIASVLKIFGIRVLATPPPQPGNGRELL